MFPFLKQIFLSHRHTDHVSMRMDNDKERRHKRKIQKSEGRLTVSLQYTVQRRKYWLARTKTEAVD